MKANFEAEGKFKWNILVIRKHNTFYNPLLLKYFQVFIKINNIAELSKNRSEGMKYSTFFCLVGNVDDPS